MAIKKKHTVGIFSRDGQDNFTWLIKLLRDKFQKEVQNVHPVYISNDYRTFDNALSQCTFAILYHTKKRGRLNVTDVTDSLYDKDLKDLSNYLDSKNVVVLLDDLEDSSDDNKRRILLEQHTIGTCARTLILISETEKESSNLDGSDPKMSQSPTSPQLQDDYNSICGKIHDLMGVMSESLKRNPDARDYDETPSVSSYGTPTRDAQHYDETSTVSAHGIQPRDQESMRSSSVYNSEQHRLIQPSNPDTAIDMKTSDKRQKESKREPTNEGRTGNIFNLSNKALLWSLGGIICILLIILIIVLCLTV
ncbi:uncharacterized protein LOC142098239 [Mixophyes fleayi]|uniref:uncharacterized protein LOC142098239 n=1 Tax=Mixophyes fleayi TaxID=3061075 RepID=UPI003F4D9EA1